jgi:hypothetical protein
MEEGHWSEFLRKLFSWLYSQAFEDVKNLSF